MTLMSSFSLGVFCPKITTSPPPESTVNLIINRTGLLGVSIVKWSGHDCVSTSHPWPNDVTTCTCPTNACVYAVFVIPGCPCRASTSSSCIDEIHEPESISTLVSAAPESPRNARHHATCCTSGDISVVRSTTYPRWQHHFDPAVRPRHGRMKRCSYHHMTAATRVPAAAPEQSEDLAL